MVWLVLYIIVNMGVFIWQFQYFYTNTPLRGPNIAFSRASAQVCLLQSFLLFFPIMHTLITKFHPRFYQYVPFDDHLVFHKICGLVMVISGLFHTVYQVYGFYDRPETKEIGDFNQAQDMPRQPSLLDFVQTLPGWTGVILVLCCVIVTPLTAFKRKHYNLFWYSHMVGFTVIFMAMFFIHGTEEWLYPTQAWLWAGVPYILYLVDRKRRIFTQYFTILHVRMTKNVVEVKIEKELKDVDAGMFVYLNCPDISKVEWHPFTLSSAPFETSLTLHIQMNGDWIFRHGVHV